jgi:hypothetical protein
MWQIGLKREIGKEFKFEFKIHLSYVLLQQQLQNHCRDTIDATVAPEASAM